MLARIGREFMNGHPKRLGCRSLELRWWPVEKDTLINQVREVRKLGSNEFGGIHALPVRLDEQVLACRKPCQPIIEVLSKLLWIICTGGLNATACTTARRFFAL